jgi:hypothetical protein
MSFSLGLIDWAICLVVLSSSILFGLYVAVRKRSSADSSRFLLADRSLPWPLVGASLFATNIGADHLVGLSGDAYRYRLSAGTVVQSTPVLTASPLWKRSPIGTLTPLATTALSGEMARPKRATPADKPASQVEEVRGGSTTESESQAVPCSCESVKFGVQRCDWGL